MAPLSSRRRLARHCLLGLLLWHGLAQGAAPDEYQVKAVYLFNFGQFVEWPPSAYASGAAPFVIGILGHDPFGSTLDDVVRGEAFGGRPVQVRRFRDLDEVRDCQILFIARGERARLAAALDELRGRSVLTVTDIDDVGRAGAIIVLFQREQRIRMRIDLAAARASGLVISSKLLRPAEVLGTEGQ